MAKTKMVVTLGRRSSFHPEEGRYERPGFNWDHLNQLAAIELTKRLQETFPYFDVQVRASNLGGPHTRLSVTGPELLLLTVSKKTEIAKVVMQFIQEVFVRLEEMPRNQLIEKVRSLSAEE